MKQARARKHQPPNEKDMRLSRRDFEQNMGECHGGILTAACCGGQLLEMEGLFACYLDEFHEDKKTWLKLLRCLGIDLDGQL